jgi:hypothetical protein
LHRAAQFFFTEAVNQTATISGLRLCGDIRRANWHFRVVPKADVSRCSIGDAQQRWLLDHLVG